MFIYLLYILLCVTLSRSDELMIKDSGIGFIDDDDIAIIFYVTLENQSDMNFEVSVSMTQCCDTMKQNDMDCNSMSLIGGDMGVLPAKNTKNVTLIYPNLYLRNRQGQCTVNIRYRNERAMRQRMARIEFKTVVPNQDSCDCATLDMDPMENCRPVDCVVKYSGMRSYFDTRRMECSLVTSCVSPPNQCSPETGYSISINNCTNLNNTIGKEELHLLDSNRTETNQCMSCPLSNTVCHHGTLDNNGQCECDAGWITTTDEEIFSPTLLTYHMCNVEVGAWNCLNKRRIRTTTILIAIFAVTIASKILILMCVLNWCYKRYKHKKEQMCSDKLDPDRDDIILCDQMQEFNECECEEQPRKKSHLLETQTVNVCYYPCLPSSFSSACASSRSDKCNKCSIISEESIVLSKTTSSSAGAAVSFVSERSESEDVATEASEQAMEDGNYGVEVNRGEDECSDLDPVVRGEEFYGEEGNSTVEVCDGLCEQLDEQSDYTGYLDSAASRRGSSLSKSKSVSTVNRSRTSTNTKE